MNPVARWMKFNAVGVLGMGVQLAALAGLNRLFAGHYLVATGMALELTLLHNFWWHQRFTWRDRPTSARALWRFHVSNGLVSLCGNLLLMRLLVQGAHVPLLVANLGAIVCCSVANFALSTRWAFAPPVVNNKKGNPMMRTTTLLFAFVAATAALGAQGTPLPTTESPQLPTGPAAQAKVVAPIKKAPNVGNWSYEGRVGVSCGAGASTSSIAQKPTFGCGAGATLVPLPIFLEVGVVGPQANRSYLSGYLSIDGSIPLAPWNVKYLPQILLGYSRLFETGHALDYGLALALPRSMDKYGNERSLRLELRDYWTFAAPNQHNVMLRVGWMSGVAD